MKRQCHGVTLLEVLLSLVMLSALAVAGVQWSLGASRAASRVSQVASFEIACAAWFDLIAEHLTTGDFLGDPTPRASVESGVLLIRGRHEGRAVLWRYRHDAESKRLWLECRLPQRMTDTHSAAGPRPLLGGIDDLELSIDPATSTLSVRLAGGPLGRVFERSYRIP